MKNAYFVTSSIAGGKSSFIEIVKELGFETISADCIAHDLLNKHYKEIIYLFDDCGLLNNSTIDRKKLGARVFGNLEDKRKLEEFIHPKIKNEILKKVEELEKKKKAFFVELPLFFESDAYKNYGKSILIYAPNELLLHRLMSRNDLSQEEALKRLHSQINIEDKKKMADFVIDNSKTYEIFKSNVLSFLRNDLKVIR